MHMVATAAAHRRSALGVPLSARGGDGHRPAEARHAAPDRQGAGVARGLGRGAAVTSARGCRTASSPPSSSPASACRRPWPTRALPSRSTWTLIRQLARNHEVLITVEEGSSGGFGAQVLQALAREGLLDRGLESAHAHPARQLHRAEQAARYVCRSRSRCGRHRRRVFSALGKDADAAARLA